MYLYIYIYIHTCMHICTRIHAYMYILLTTIIATTMHHVPRCIYILNSQITLKFESDLTFEKRERERDIYIYHSECELYT